MAGRFKIAMCQMEVGECKEKNVAKAVQMIEDAAGYGAGLVVLPEMFNCPYENARFPLFAEEAANSPTLNSISEAAGKKGVYVVAGSIPELFNEKLYNTSFVFDNYGKIIARHRKLHLFDIDVPGRITFHESDVLSPGYDMTTFETSFCKVGVAICYDMRFPELIRLLALKGAEMIIVPGAFNMTTGPAHWELLVRGRALDNQVFFAAVSPARNTASSYIAYGHSMAADPWGNILAQAGEGEEIIYADIDLELLKKTRNELPLMKNRRTDLYELKSLNKL